MRSYQSPFPFYFNAGAMLDFYFGTITAKILYDHLAFSIMNILRLLLYFSGFS